MTSHVAGRVFASHYQLLLCDDPARPVPEEANWTEEDVARGFSGDARTRLVGTEADLNDHWIEVSVVSAPPDLAEWQRVTLVSCRSETGRFHVMSVIDDAPRLSLQIGVGEFSVYVAGQNIGVDRSTLGEDGEISDEELAQRLDLERYHIFVVPGPPTVEGRVRDAG